jgi:hypothetical protein
MRQQSALIDDLNAKEAQLAETEERSTEGWNLNAAARAKVSEVTDTLASAIERASEILAAETDAVVANTEAWARNAAARAAVSRVGFEGAGVGTVESAAVGSRPIAIEKPKPASIGEQSALFDTEAGAQQSLLGGTEGKYTDPFKVPQGAEEYGQIAARNEAALASFADEQAVVNDLTNRSAAAYAASSQALQAHGALTQEFIQSLVRGEVTLQEFGSQLTTTIGKFSGWAVAGGLVYGTFESIKKVGDGLTETQSGVEQLKRSLGASVNANQAAAGFRNVSKEVNVSIREVADAQFYSARAFKTQDESLAVAKTALEAYKLDQVNAQEAVKSFGALNATFGSNASEIAHIFDILDTGQLKFNSRLNQTLPQMGRAALSFHDAGGSASELAEILIELNRATGGGGGQGGGNPATALIRAPANLAKPATEDVLRQFGFDPKFAQEHIGEFIKQVQGRAAIPQGQRGYLNNQDIRQLSTAVGGGSALGLRYFEPLFGAGRSGLSKEVEEAGSKAHGSAQEDLNHKLAQFDEQVVKLGRDLEGYGSRLASIGLGPVLSDAVTVLHYFLESIAIVTTPIVLLGEAFTDLPGPIREIAEAMLAVKAARLVAGGQRGLVARKFAEEGGLTYLGGGAKELTAAQATQRSVVEAGKREQASLAQRSYQASLQSSRATAAVASFRRSPEEIASLSPEERKAYETEMTQREANQARLAGLQEKAMEDQLFSQQELVARQDVLKQLMNRRVSIEERLVVASEAGIYVAQTGTPNTKALLAPNQAAAEQEAERVRTAKTAVLAQSPSTAAAGGEDAIAGGEDAAIAGTTVLAENATLTRRAIATTSTAMETAGSVLVGTFGDVKAFGVKMLDFIKGFGVLGGAFLAYAGLEEIGKLADVEGFQARAKEGGQLAKAPITSESEARERLARFSKEAHEATTVSVKSVSRALVGEVKAGFGLFGETEEEREEELVNRRNQLAKEVKSGKFKPLGSGEAKLTEGEKLEEYVASYKDFIDGLLEPGEKAEKAKAGIETENKLLLDRVKLFGAKGSESKSTFSQIAAGQGALIQRAVQTQNAEQLDAASSVGDAAFAGILSSVSEQFKRSNKSALSSAQRQAALKEAEGGLKGYENLSITQPKKEEELYLGKNEGQLRSVESRLTQKNGPKAQKKLEGERETLKAAIEGRKEHLKDLGQLAATEAERIEEALDTLFTEGFTKEAARIKSVRTLQSAKAGKRNTVGSENIQLQGLEEELKVAKEDLKGPEGENKIRELEAGVIEATRKRASSQLNRIKAEASHSEASKELQTDEPVAIAENQLQKAQQQASFIISHKKDFSLEEDLNAQTEVLKAKKALREAIYNNESQLDQLRNQISQAQENGNAEGQARLGIQLAGQMKSIAQNEQEKLQANLDLVNAENQLLQARQTRITEEANLAKSKTNSPVKAARIDVKADEQLLKLSQGPDQKIKSEAELNNARKAYQETLVQETENWVNFELSMGAISSQQAIDRLQQLLRAKDINKSTRDQIKQQIYQLENSATTNGTYDLAPGNIKLPTAFDVQRAISSAVAGHGPSLIHAPSEVSVVNQIVVNVDQNADVHKVADAIDRATGSRLKSRLKAVGVR